MENIIINDNILDRELKKYLNKKYYNLSKICNNCENPNQIKTEDSDVGIFSKNMYENDDKFNRYVEGNIAVDSRENVYFNCDELERKDEDDERDKDEKKKNMYNLELDFDNSNSSEEQTNGGEKNNSENLLEFQLKDLIKVFMEQNSQFEFLNKFYENTEESESNNIDMNEHQSCITNYNIYIWKNIYICDTSQADEIKIDNVICIAKDKLSAINILKKRYYTSKSQLKNKKKLFCNLDKIKEDKMCKIFFQKLYQTKCFVFPCQNFSCFY